MCFFAGLGICMIRDSNTAMLGQYFKKKRPFVEMILACSSGLGHSLICHLLSKAIKWVKFIYSEKATKGPGAKNAIRENPGYFYQILNFESWKWSPVATFESGSNKSALSFFDFQLFHVQNQVLTQIVTILGHFFPRFQ